jgi:mannitol/fructose-specific phosphotransferase system IIA component (Ntr-type)
MFRAAFSMCEDINWKIRVIAATELRHIIPLCDSASNFTETFLKELVELLNDDDSFVKVEAIETFAEIIEHLTKEALMENFVSTIKEQYSS